MPQDQPQTMKRSLSTAGAKLGLKMHGGGNVEDIQSPNKANHTAAIQSLPTSGTKKDRGITLTSYSQLRNRVKKDKTDHLSNSVDNFTSNSLIVSNNKKTFGLKSDLSSLREKHKRNKEKTEDQQREEELFGDLHEIEIMRNTIQPGARRTLQNNFVEDSKEHDFIPFEPYKDDLENSETEFDNDMNEHEGVGKARVPGKIAQTPTNKLPSRFSLGSDIAIRQSKLINQSGLEPIKEQDDINNSPIKKTKLAAPRNYTNKITAHYENNGHVNTEPTNHEKILRRNTVGIKQPSKLVAPQTKAAHVVKVQDEPRKRSINTIQSSNYHASNFHENKIDHDHHAKIEAAKVGNVVPKTGLKGLSNQNRTSGLKTPMNKVGTKLFTDKQDNQEGLRLSQKTISDMSEHETPEIKQPKKLHDDKAKENHRKMMAERKLLLKQKIAAIKIQKYWRARHRRRKMRFEKLRIESSIRRIQRWYRHISHKIKVKNAIMNNGLKNLAYLIFIQKEYRKYRDRPKKINIPHFKLTLLAVLKGWKVRRVLDVLKSEQKTREAMDIIILYEESKKKTNDLFFKQFNEKFPEMVEFFHTKFDEMIHSNVWYQKPVVQNKVLVSVLMLLILQIGKQKGSQI